MTSTYGALLVFPLLVAAHCGNAEKQTYTDETAVWRWSATSSQGGSVLATACFLPSGPYFDGGHLPDIGQAKRIQVPAAVGDEIDVRVSFEQVKAVSEHPLPASDTFWCGSQVETFAKVYHLGMGCLRVIGPDPPAILEELSLVDPAVGHPDEGSGFNLRLKIQHAGTLRTGEACSAPVSSVVAEADATNVMDQLTIL